MEMGRTFFLSLMMHISLLFLFSAVFLGGGRERHAEKAFFVELKELVPEASEPRAEDYVSVEKKDISVRKEAKTEKHVERERRNEGVIIIPAERFVYGENGALPDISGSIPVIQSAASVSAGEETDTPSSTETFSQRTEDIKSGGTGALTPEMIQLIGSMIDNAKSYPAMARRRGIEGTVFVSFSIGAEGDAREITVIKSSGYRILDEATVKVVNSAAPYPYVRESIEVPVTYRLSD